MIDAHTFRAWAESPSSIMPALVAVGLLAAMYQSGLLEIWTMSDEYGHGLMVVGVLAYLVYRRWDAAWMVRDKSVWFCVPISILAVVFAIAGTVSGISIVVYYAIWLFAVAVALGAGGWTLLRQLLVPLCITLLLLPLPNPYGPMLTSSLQLVSSKLGVWFIRSLGGTVYLEGNVLDMGPGAKLLVAEACAGLRYLFPLMSLGAIAAYLLRGPLWIRWSIFLITIPITILMNSARIAATGLLVEGGDSSHTEGLLHLFEGWVVFVVAALALWGAAWVLMKFQPAAGGLAQALSLDSPVATAQSSPGGTAAPIASLQGNSAKLPLSLVTVCLYAATLASLFLAAREPIIPERQSFADFPMLLGNWVSHEDRLPPDIEAVAGASEYYYGDFALPSGEAVNVYMAYYETQRHGQVPHSPKVCIPGGGWMIESNEPITLSQGSGKSFLANRLVSSKGENKTLTYYWLKQGSNLYNQELLARLDLVRFSLVQNRTDGALIRVATSLAKGESVAQAEDRLRGFLPGFVSTISAYVPD